MARPTWRGAISFGMVSVPVQLFTAVRSHDVRFKQLRRGTNHLVKQKRVDAETGEEVAFDDIVKGYEVGAGRYVVVEPEELDELDPNASRSIEIQDFVQQAEIDPVHYDRAYYLAPDGETAAKPYTLLAQAMGAADKVAVAQFVMRGKEYLAAIRARDGMLVLSTMHYADEVADPAELTEGGLDLDVEIRDRELDMAEQLIASMTGEFDPGSYRNEHRDRVVEYLEAKATGEQVEIEPGERETGEVIDLMAALERSLDRARGGSDQDQGSADDGRAADTAGAGAEAADQDLAAMSRDELYELAQQRDVPGRSGMTKAQLVEALSRADVGAA